MKNLILSAALLVASTNAWATPVYVQLDSTATTVTGEFSRPQSQPTPPGYTVIDSSDSRYVAWLTLQSGMESCGAAKAIGVTFTNASGSLPEATGTWSISSESRTRAQGIAAYIQSNGKFPSGLSALPWPDLSGAVHRFTSVADFTKWANAIVDYGTALDLACDAVKAGEAWSPPANPQSIP